MYIYMYMSALIKVHPIVLILNTLTKSCRFLFGLPLVHAMQPVRCKTSALFAAVKYVGASNGP